MHFNIFFLPALFLIVYICLQLHLILKLFSFVHMKVTVILIIFFVGKDLRCHSTMIRWPKNMMNLFKETSVELRQKKEEAENKLSDRINMLNSNLDFCARRVKSLPLSQVW